MTAKTYKMTAKTYTPNRSIKARKAEALYLEAKEEFDTVNRELIGLLESKPETPGLDWTIRVGYLRDEVGYLNSQLHAAESYLRTEYLKYFRRHATAKESRQLIAQKFDELNYGTK